jgi:carboxymethylenebutenolidase
MSTTDGRTPGITRQSIPVQGGDLPLTIARSGGAGAAVVIMPSAFGVGPDLEAQMTELAADARLVVAIDPFFREDPGSAPYEDMARAMSRVQKLDRGRAYGDLRAAIDWVHGGEGSPSVVVLGICLGGPFALLAAADGAVQGVVTWHGTRVEQQLGRAAEIRCPMRLHFGTADPVVPMDAVEAIRAAFAGRPDVRVVVHEGATHGFSHRARPQAYDERAERAGMASVRELAGEVGRRG